MLLEIERDKGKVAILFATFILVILLHATARGQIDCGVGYDEWVAGCAGSAAIPNINSDNPIIECDSGSIVGNYFGPRQSVTCSNQGVIGQIQSAPHRYEVPFSLSAPKEVCATCVATGESPTLNEALSCLAWYHLPTNWGQPGQCGGEEIPPNEPPDDECYTFGNPVNFVTGEKFERVVDYVMPVGKMAPVFGRRYTSQRKRSWKEEFKYLGSSVRPFPRKRNNSYYAKTFDWNGWIPTLPAPGTEPVGWDEDLVIWMPRRRTYLEILDQNLRQVFEPQWDFSFEARVEEISQLIIYDENLEGEFSKSEVARGYRVILPPGPWPTNRPVLRFGMPEETLASNRNEGVNLYTEFKEPASASAVASSSIMGVHAMNPNDVEYTLVFLNEAHLYFGEHGYLIGVEDLNGNGYVQEWNELDGYDELDTIDILENDLLIVHTSGAIASVQYRGSIENATGKENQEIEVDTNGHSIPGGVKIKYEFEEYDPGHDWSIPKLITSAKVEFDSPSFFRYRTDFTYANFEFEELLLLESKREIDYSSGQDTLISESKWTYGYSGNPEGYPVCLSSEVVKDENGTKIPGNDVWSCHYGYDGARTITQKINGEIDFTAEYAVDYEERELSGYHSPNAETPDVSLYNTIEENRSRINGSYLVGKSEAPGETTVDYYYHSRMHYEPNQVGVQDQKIDELAYIRKTSASVNWENDDVARIGFRYLPSGHGTIADPLKENDGLLQYIDTPYGTTVELDYTTASADQLVGLLKSIKVYPTDDPAKTTSELTVAYDEANLGHPSFKGLVTSITGSKPRNAKVTFKYNSNGYIETISVKTPSGGNTSIGDIDYEYDEHGYLKKITESDPSDPTGITKIITEPTFDPVGRILSIVYPTTAADGQAYDATYEYYAGGLIGSIEGIDGRRSDFSYDVY